MRSREIINLARGFRFLRVFAAVIQTELRSGNTGNIFLQHVSQHLKHIVARITTLVTNLSRNKIQCCKLRQRVAQSRLEFYFLQQIPVLPLVLPTNLNIILVTDRREARQIK